MIRRPFSDEWDISGLPTDRREYLDADPNFEDIAARACAELRVVRGSIKRYKSPATGEPKNARQVVFRVEFSGTTNDLLWNARDGLRSRYWQSPEHGYEATKHLIVALLPKLIAFAKENDPAVCKGAAEMTWGDISASLEAPSAKIWPLERDDDGNGLFCVQQLVVPRWASNEERAPNKAMWRQTPVASFLEIKGGRFQN